MATKDNEEILYQTVYFFQEASFVYDTKSSPADKEINHDVLFREGRNLMVRFCLEMDKTWNCQNLFMYIRHSISTILK